MMITFKVRSSETCDVHWETSLVKLLVSFASFRTGFWVTAWRKRQADEDYDRCCLDIRLHASPQISVQHGDRV